MLTKDEGNFLEPPFVPRFSSPIRLKESSGSLNLTRKEIQKFMGVRDARWSLITHSRLYFSCKQISKFPNSSLNGSIMMSLFGKHLHSLSICYILTTSNFIKRGEQLLGTFKCLISQIIQVAWTIRLAEAVSVTYGNSWCFACWYLGPSKYSYLICLGWSPGKDTF